MQWIICTPLTKINCILFVKLLVFNEFHNCVVKKYDFCTRGSDAKCIENKIGEALIRYSQQKPKIAIHMIEKKCWLTGAIASVASQANKALIIRCVYIAESIYIYIYTIFMDILPLFHFTHMFVDKIEKRKPKQGQWALSTYRKNTDIYIIIFR